MASTGKTKRTATPVTKGKRAAASARAGAGGASAKAARRAKPAGKTTGASGRAKTASASATKKAAGGRAGTARSRTARSNVVSTGAAKGTKDRGTKRAVGTGATTPTRGSKSKPRAAGASPATSQDPIQFHEEDRPLPKTRLTGNHLEKFKELLLQKRAELAGDVERLTEEALNRKNDGTGDHSSMPIHMADLGSDNWEQDFTLGLIANEQALVREIDDALCRIQNRTYGVCLATHRRISLARLRAKPWAKYCIEHARAREEGRAS